MASIQLAPEVGDDIERILDHLAQFQVEDAPGRIQGILEAIAVLEHNPLIGRPVEAETKEAGMRELVIGRRARGYVALYRYAPELDLAKDTVARSISWFSASRSWSTARPRPAASALVSRRQTSPWTRAPKGFQMGKL